MTDDQMTEEMKALRRLLPLAPVVTPKALCVALGWLLVHVRAELEAHPPVERQAYARPRELAGRMGISEATMKNWLARLECDGEIHPLQGTPLKEGARGDTLYSIGEVEAALRRRRMGQKGKVGGHGKQS